MITRNGLRNTLLLSLAQDDFELLQPYLQRVPHRNGDCVAQMDTDLDKVLFPEGAVSALLNVLQDGTRLAFGVVGFEGMIGSAVLHGATTWAHEVVVRAADAHAICIRSDRLLQACAQSTTLRDQLLRYAGNLMLQIGATGMSSASQPLEQRLARWILLYHDRLDSDEVAMTHNEIAIMLGVRRASATDVLHVLEGRLAIRSLRGRILVRNRALLEEIAGESYGEPERDYRRQIGPFGRGCRAASQPSVAVQAPDWLPSASPSTRR